MKLSKHQKQIVDEIIKGTVYDIPTYLKTFNKWQLCKYDLTYPYEKFKEEEGGKQYKVITDESKAYHIGTTPMDMGIGTINVTTKLLKKAEDIPDDAWEYREAELIRDIKPLEIEYNGATFSFDFMENGVYVADDFNDIIEFMSLWTYLRQESLILEVPRDVTSDDLGVLFELKTVEPKKKSAVIIHKDKEQNSTLHPVTRITLDLDSLDSFYPHCPSCLLSSYMTEAWEINGEHQKNCQEYIGRKILPTEKLRVFARQFYTTTGEWQYRIPLFISIVALLISFMPIIQSLLPSSEPDHVAQISQQISNIEIMLENEQLVVEDLISIKETLDIISDELSKLDQSNTDALILLRDELANVSEVLNELNPEQNSEIVNTLVRQLEQLIEQLQTHNNSQ